MGLQFLVNSIFLGVGLAMDAFSVSLADGLNEPGMKGSKRLWICGAFGFFQALMPLTGWFCVRRMLSCFQMLIPLVPWISLAFLVLIGISMIREGRQAPEAGKKASLLTPGTLLIQAVATSLDALSVGFAIAQYDFRKAAVCAAIIAGVTFPICLAGISLGRKVGNHLSGKAMILGGAILIAVGIEIWATGIL